MSKRQHAKKSPTDETLYCERCAISFLWSREEQVTHPDAELANELAAVQANVSPRPPLCPGCRKLLPQASRERGLVKWFNHRKRYGFLTRTGQPDLFVHRSEISPGARLHPGDLVEFTVSESQRGPSATQVSLLLHVGSADSSVDAPARNRRRD